VGIGTKGNETFRTTLQLNFIPTRIYRRRAIKLDRIHQIALYARDLDEAISFYRDRLGVHYLKKVDPPGLAFLEFSGVHVLQEKEGPKGTLYFWVDDIDSAYAELNSKGIEFTVAPHLIHQDDTGVFGEPGNEEWMAFFSDPSGNILALATQKSGSRWKDIPTSIPSHL
jgi:catechol 2,3-dioxygenase-like lactoylglutathione lyase family enzyme